MVDSSGLLFYYFSKVELRKIQVRDYIASVENFDTHSLTVFSSANKNVEVIDKHEIRYNGKMYDIVKTEKKEAKILYYVISDNKEDELLSDIARLAKHHSDKSHLPGKRAACKILKIVNNNHSLSYSLYAVNPNADRFTGEPQYYPSPLKAVLSPPPRHLFS